jgi:hypothetical protein
MCVFEERQETEVLGSVADATAVMAGKTVGLQPANCGWSPTQVNSPKAAICELP